MRPLLQHASRALFASPALVAPPKARNAALTSFATPSSTRSVCWSCQFRAASSFLPRASRQQLNRDFRPKRTSPRRFYSSQDRPDKGNDDAHNGSAPIAMPPPPPPHSQPNEYAPEREDLIHSPEATSMQTPPSLAEEPVPEKDEPLGSPEDTPKTSPEPLVEEKTTTAGPTPEPDVEPEAAPKSKPSPFEETIHRVPEEDLPSHRERQRWDFSKKISELMDEILPKLAVVTQKVNTYTGTDYSSIEALRQEIKDQEKLVKARRLAIDDAKHALDAAHAQQGSSQKEVVALLERKHSWSAADLERYMSLIRSEHLNDQAIREAKDAVKAAEGALEEARSQLEKRERQQYHEEQIWSDTIRRNSTWVTFGLMGVNIFLLLLSLLFLEPWRRRRMVREIKAALADAQIAATPAPAAATAALPLTATADESGNDNVVPAPVSPAPQNQEANRPETEAAQADLKPTDLEAAPADLETAPAGVAETTAADIPDQASIPLADLAVAEELQEADVIAHTNIEDELEELDMTRLERITANIEKIPARLESLVSDEPMTVRKKDLTAAICASLVAGYACAVLAFWMGMR